MDLHYSIKLQLEYSYYILYQKTYMLLQHQYLFLIYLLDALGLIGINPESGGSVSCSSVTLPTRFNTSTYVIPTLSDWSQALLIFPKLEYRTSTQVEDTYLFIQPMLISRSNSTTSYTIQYIKFNNYNSIILPTVVNIAIMQIRNDSGILRCKCGNNSNYFHSGEIICISW